MKIQYRKTKAKNQLEAKRDRTAHLAHIFHGEGLYVFRNKTKGDLKLAKPASDGRKTIPSGETWEGDNYFMNLIPKEASLVKTVMTPQQEREKNMSEKLILDQPDTVTKEGKVEHVIVDTMRTINETPENEPKKDVLLTEDPMDGVQILVD